METLLTKPILAYLLPETPVVIKRWHKPHISIFPPTTCTALVPWNGPLTLGSTIGLPKFTLYLRSIMYLSSFHLSVMVGVLLGDAYIRRGGDNRNARILFGQSLVNFPYLWFVFTLLSPYCAGLPYLDSSVIKGVRHYRAMFTTRTYTVMNELYDMFYVEGIKVVPQEIYHLLSPVALAHWISCDGAGIKQGGVLLCTDGFTVSEARRGLPSRTCLRRVVALGIIF
jgi:LAGLIDADG DNA endonuclease family.